MPIPANPWSGAINRRVSNESDLELMGGGSRALEDTLLEEMLYQEQLLPVCSPALLVARGQPSGPADLYGWPLLYDLGWDTDWSYWFTRQKSLSPEQAAQLRQRMQAGERKASLARQFGISRETLYQSGKNHL